MSEGIRLIEQIEAKGFEAYFIGGCVRDYLLRLPMTDIDLTTSATPQELRIMFPTLIPIGIDHGTVLVRSRHMSFEITTFRTKEPYADKHALHDLTIDRSLKEDVKRRDFTMNAIAMNRHMQLIDYCHGQKDIEARLIRAVDDPLERMHEDPLRILRGIRFVSQLGFMIDESTKRAMKQSAHLLETVARERLNMECERLFTQTYVKDALEQLLQIGVDQYIPVFKEEPMLIRTIIKNIQPLASFSEVIALMHLHAPQHTVIEWVREWKCSNKIKQEANRLIQSYTYAIQQGRINSFIIYQLHGHIEPFFRVYSIMQQSTNIKLSDLYELKEALPIVSRSELQINGNDILNLFPHRKPGRWLDEMLRKIEYKVVMQELTNDQYKLKEWIMCNRQDTN